MEEMYQEYKDIAEFRIVYIREAHAIDSIRPTEFAQHKGIFEAKDFGQRCTTAEVMMKETEVSIPFIIDNMDNQVASAYQALPDRIFVVRKDGRLAVAAGRGPRGFVPALKDTRTWLGQYRTTGEEPELSANYDTFQ